MFESTVVCGRITLGKQGENNARKVSFVDADIWKERFGQGRFELLHQRNGDVAPYPVVLTIEDGVPYWYVTNADTAVEGEGMCELRYIVDDKVIKSCTYVTDVIPGLGDGTEPPEPYESWVDVVITSTEIAKDSADIAKDHADIAKDHAEEASYHAEIATNSATSANESADVAKASSEEAQSAADEAKTFAQVAEQSKEEVIGLVGDMDKALDEIIATQEAFIGGAE